MKGLMRQRRSVTPERCPTSGRTSLPLRLVVHSGAHLLLRDRVPAERVRVVVAVAVVSHLGLLGAVVIGRHVDEPAG